MTKRGKIILGNSILVIIVILIVGVLGYYFWKNQKSYVPQKFIEARSQSAVLAADLVSNLNELVKDLANISEKDQNGEYSEALKLVNQESDRMEKVKNDSKNLSIELINMAEVLQEIKPANAESLAFDAIKIETSLLVDHINNYNSYFTSLLNLLKNKFLNNGVYSGNENVRQYIDSMNKEAESINSLNVDFNQKLKEFDSAVN
jgi:uncharacterized protein (UPF0333 family)